MKRLALVCLVTLLVGAAALVACSGDNNEPAGPTATGAANATAAGPTGTADASTTRLVIIDQNILHGIIDEDPDAEPFDRFPERIQLLASSFAAAQPDALMLQEVLGDPGPDYPDVRGELLTALGAGYQAVFGNFLGGPIDAGGLGQMTITRLSIVSSENRTVSAIRSVHRVTVQTGAGPLQLYNAHLEGTGAVLETGEDGAVLEVQNIIDFIEETRSGGPVILAGDFNAQPGDPSIQALLAAGFVDAPPAGDATCDKAGDPGYRTPPSLWATTLNNADCRIDYIRPPWRPVDVTVAEASFNNEPPISAAATLLASDHIACVRALELTRSNAARVQPAAPTPARRLSWPYPLSVPHPSPYRFALTLPPPLLPFV
jgi:endonuclease/exonuclease/phosphatase family metal-dependent hydrolase